MRTDEEVIMTTTLAMRKIAISLPRELVAFADDWAAANQNSRSQAISLILAAAKRDAEAQLAAEGYQFYAQEAIDFAESSNKAVAESLLTEEWLDLQPDGLP